MSQENNQEDRLLRELFEIYGESLKDPARDRQIQEKCLLGIKLLKDIATHRTEACLETDQIRDYINGEPDVLEQHKDHVAKCTDYCQRLVEFYKKK